MGIGSTLKKIVKKVVDPVGLLSSDKTETTIIDNSQNLNAPVDVQTEGLSGQEVNSLISQMVGAQAQQQQLLMQQMKEGYTAAVVTDETPIIQSGKNYTAYALAALALFLIYTTFIKKGK